MRKSNVFIAMVVCLAVSVPVLAQKKDVGGEFAAGVRLGGTTALTLKKYSNYNRSAWEGIIGWNFDNEIDGFNTSLLWEKLAPLSSSSKLSAEFGFGVTAIFGDEFYFGPSGIIGFDWRLKSIPITMSFDWMPTWIIVNDSHFSGTNGAFSIRWVLNQKRYK